jgi:alpha-L-rhamnosidase
MSPADKNLKKIQSPTDLACEYTVNPLGIDEHQPRFSWILQHSERGRKQSAYQILVASSRNNLINDKGDIWDSGKVESDKSVNIEYAGKPLKHKTAYRWKVRWWDDEGQTSPYSEIASFEMGFLAKKDWKAKWIGGNNILRKRFDIKGEIEQARAYICGLGWYELRINGKKVGDHQLDPGQTDYEKVVLYSTYDITDLLKNGENAIGVMLGKGRYVQDWSGAGVIERLTAEKNAVPKVIMQLEIRFKDGSRKTFITDETWKVADSPIIEDDIYNGETYDARLEKTGWDNSGYDDSRWEEAKLTTPPAGQLVSQGTLPPIKIIKTIQPLMITNPQPGVFVYDLGQNFTGWVRLTVSGPRGAEVKLRFAELTYPDGMINPTPNRVAKVTDTYILKGEGNEVYEPRFTYHGFRYMEVTGFPGTPDLNTIQGIVVHSSVKPVGGFSCSNELINSIHKNILWTQLSNLMSVPTDCPQRNERMGWMGDAQLVVEESIFNFDMAAFYTKWLRDIRESQREDGSVSDVVPPYWQRYPADPPWGTACVVVPWNLYLYYDDKRVLEENYQLMKRWVEFLTTKSKNHLVQYSKYGDWCPPGKMRSLDTPGILISSWCYYHDALTLSKIGGILGKKIDVKKYATLAQSIKEAINEEFLEDEYYSHNSRIADHLLLLDTYAPADRKNRRKGGLYSQTANILPLYMDMVPEEKKAVVLQYFFENVEVTHDCHVSTGILGTRYLFETLTKYGRPDLAYRIVTQTTYPSWGYMIKEGATTIWERWEYMAGKGMNSHNHIMFGTVDTWFYRVLAGINQDVSAPSFKKIVIKPYIPADLNFASASVKTIRGLVSSSWKKERNGLTLDIVLPVNCEAEISLPITGLKNPLVMESGKAVFKNNSFVKGVSGITDVKRNNEYITFTAGSGMYSFWAGE